MSEHSFNQPLKDEISLNDIIDFLSESWKTIALTGLMGIVGSIAYLWMTPSQYQAIANFQVARVASSDVEPPALLVEKMKIPSYYSQKTHLACNVIEAVNPGMAIVNNLKPTLSKTAPIINIKYQATSYKEAINCLEAVLGDVRDSQSILSKPIIATKSMHQLTLKQKLDASESFLKKLPIKNSNYDFSDSKFSSSALLLATTIMKENEIKDLQIHINDIELSLADPQTKETFLSAPIYASQQKVSPKRSIILMVGMMAGLFFGLVLVLGKRALTSYRAANPKS